MRSAIDTNVISALWSREPLAKEMAEVLQRARQAGGLVICAAVYAELHAYPKATRDFIETFLETTGITVDYSVSNSVWQKVAEVYGDYAERRRGSGGGQPKRLLVDFLVGAHALLEADQLLTLDPARYQTSFPKLKLVPEPRQ
jgi:predicted nucleic acid-binding protein